MSHDISLGSAKRPNVEEARPQDAQQPVAIKLEARENGNAVITKRKYRRHPKVGSILPGNVETIVGGLDVFFFWMLDLGMTDMSYRG